MQSRSKASTRQAAQASQQAIALHYADKDANTLARRSSGKIRAGASNGGGGGEELEDDPPWQRRMTATEERRVRRRLDQLEKANVVDPPFKEFKEGLDHTSLALANETRVVTAADENDDDEDDGDDESRPSKRARPNSTATATLKAAVKPGSKARAAAPAVAPPPPKTMLTAAIRTLLTPNNRRTLAELLAEQPHAPYFSSTARPPSHPLRRFCLPCGALGRYTCERCKQQVCSMACRTKHDEDACGRG